MHFLEYLLYSNVHFSVTSARRTPEQNKACNGAPNSQHLVGEAVDIKPYGSTTFNKLLEEIHFFSDNVSRACFMIFSMIVATGSSFCKTVKD